MNSIYDKECILIEINSRLLGFDMDDKVTIQLV